MKSVQAKKGLTPIIAVILLLMMTVAAAGLAYQFVIGTQSDVQDRTTEQVATQTKTSDIQFRIEEVVKQSANGNMLVRTRNTGKIALVPNSLTFYVDGILAGTEPDLLDVGSIEGTDTGFGWPAVGTNKIVRIAHASGISLTYTCSPASSTATVC